MLSSHQNSRAGSLILLTLLISTYISLNDIILCGTITGRIKLFVFSVHFLHIITPENNINFCISKGVSMLRSVGIVLVAVLLLALPVKTSAFAFVETVHDYGISAPGYNYVSSVTFTDGYIGWGQTGSWGHTLSPAYMPVPTSFTVADARLRISGYHYAGFGTDLVQFGGELEWTGISGWRWVSFSDNTFDLTHIDDMYWNSSPLEVSLTPILYFGGVNLSSAVLSVNYDLGSGEVGGSVSTVPESGTVLLFALGLVLGSVILSRKKSLN